jgi:hypothetical protein
VLESMRSWCLLVVVLEPMRRTMAPHGTRAG